MPVTSSAKKKLRRDRRFTAFNRLARTKYRSALKTARLKPSEKTVSEAFSALDLAAKKSIIHKNKASRLKSRLAKLLK
jgi:small subunit ribosomal protein S20